MRFHIFLEDSSERETSLRDRLWMVLSDQREILQTPTEYHLPHLLQESYLQSAEIEYEPVHEISNNVVCDSDQPAHTRSLIRAFASRFVKLLTEHHLELLSIKMRPQRLVRVYTCQNATFLEISCTGSHNIGILSVYLYNVFLSISFNICFGC